MTKTLSLKKTKKNTQMDLKTKKIKVALTDDEKLFMEIKKTFNMNYDSENFNILLMMKNIREGAYTTPKNNTKDNVIKFLKKYKLHYKIYDGINNTYRCFSSTTPIDTELIIDDNLQHEVIGKFLGYECIKNIDDNTKDIPIHIRIGYNYKNGNSMLYSLIYGFICNEISRETLAKLKKKRKEINKLGKNFPSVFPEFKCIISGDFRV